MCAADKGYTQWLGGFCQYPHLAHTEQFLTLNAAALKRLAVMTTMDELMNKSPDTAASTEYRTGVAEKSAASCLCRHKFPLFISQDGDPVHEATQQQAQSYKEVLVNWCLLMIS